MRAVRHPELFRLLAIVGDTERLNDVLALARDVPQLGCGIMLRDPRHDESRIRQLANYALSLPVPGNVRLVSNAIAIRGIPIVHFTSAQLHHTADAGDSIQSTDSTLSYGVSVHTMEEARIAEQLGAAYITFSPVFPTGTKPGHPGVGVEELKRVCAGISIPVFALGGIDGSNVGECIETGAYGIAGISLFDREHRASCQTVIELLQK